jgi:hypothetical protein
MFRAAAVLVEEDMARILHEYGAIKVCRMMLSVS